MKAQLLCIAVYFMCLSLGYAVVAGGGGQETNGGDGVIAEYLMTFEGLMLELPEEISLPDGKFILKSHLRQVRRKIQFATVEELTLDGREVSALNQTTGDKKKLVLSRKSWMGLSVPARKLLVLHEQLPLSGVADPDYINSNAVYKRATTFKKIDANLMGSAILSCRQGYLKRISKRDFEGSYAENQREGYIFLAATSGCVTFISHWQEWGYSINQCRYATPLGFVLNSQIIGDFSVRLNTVKALLNAGAQPFYTCDAREYANCSLVADLYQGSQAQELRELLACP